MKKRAVQVGCELSLDASGGHPTGLSARTMRPYASGRRSSGIPLPADWAARIASGLVSTAAPTLRTWTMIHGDCMEHLRALPPASADAIITDPPYGIAFRSKIHGAIANDKAPFVWWLAEGFRVLKARSPLLCFCRWDVSAAWMQAIAWAGFKVRCQIIWDRGQGGSGDTQRTFSPSHDLAILAAKGDWKLPAGRPRDVFFARKIHHTRAVHPTQKPVELMRRLVVSLSREGDLVLDPFAGSGSTGEACLLERRRFLGIELDEKYHAIASDRLAATEVSLEHDRPANNEVHVLRGSARRNEGEPSPGGS